MNVWQIYVVHSLVRPKLASDYKRDGLKSGAATCSKGFEKCFLRAPQGVGLPCSYHSALANKENFQKTYYKTFGTCRHHRLPGLLSYLNTGNGTEGAMVCTSLGSLFRPLFYFLCYIHFSLSVAVQIGLDSFQNHQCPDC